MMRLALMANPVVTPRLSPFLTFSVISLSTTSTAGDSSTRGHGVVMHEDPHWLPHTS